MLGGSCSHTVRWMQIEGSALPRAGLGPRLCGLHCAVFPSALTLFAKTRGRWCRRRASWILCCGRRSGSARKRDTAQTETEMTEIEALLTQPPAFSLNSRLPATGLNFNRGERQRSFGSFSSDVPDLIKSPAKAKASKCRGRGRARGGPEDVERAESACDPCSSAKSRIHL